MERITTRDAEHKDWIAVTSETEAYKKLAAYEDAEEQGKLMRVVRCNECKHGTSTEKIYTDDTLHCVYCAKGNGYNNGNFFCADGEVALKEG